MTARCCRFERDLVQAGGPGFQAFATRGTEGHGPIYDVEVLTPSDYMGAVMSDLQNRRAMIMGMESDKGFDRLNARVPPAGRALPLFDHPVVTQFGCRDLHDEIRLLRAGSGRRAGQAAEGLHRHRRGVNRRNFTKEGCLCALDNPFSCRYYCHRNCQESYFRKAIICPKMSLSDGRLFAKAAHCKFYLS